MNTPAYTLYYAPGAASLAVHWLLLELELKLDQPFTAIRLDLAAGEHKQQTYLALNPQGLVPCLLIDGQPHAECAALLLLLAERHPQAQLAPPPGSSGRAAYLQWMLFLANTLQPAFRSWFYPHEAAGPAHEAAAREQARSRIEACYDRLDAALAQQDHLAGAQLSAVDFLATMLMRWSRNMPRPATDWPNLQAYVRRMRARPSFARLYEREGLSEWAAGSS